jgi:hypothetical protein
MEMQLASFVSGLVLVMDADIGGIVNAGFSFALLLEMQDVAFLVMVVGLDAEFV